MVSTTWLYVSGGETAGPVPDSVLRGLIESGYLDAGSLVWTESLEDWTPLGRVAGFEGTNTIREPEPVNRFSLMTLPGRRSSRATAAFYLGWLSGLVIPAPLAVAVSIGALRELREVRRRTGREASGRGRAIFGLAAGAIGTLMLIWVVTSAALT